MYVFTRGNLYRLRFSFAFGLHFAGRTSGRWINSEILLCDVASGTSLPEKTEQPSLGSRVKSSCVQSRISRGIGGEEVIVGVGRIARSHLETPTEAPTEHVLE